MSTSKSDQKHIDKAIVALDIILQHDEKHSDITFKNLVDEIILAWKELQ